MENKSILKQITEEAKLRGHSVRIRDIAYAVLRVKFEDSLTAYTVVFGPPQANNDISAYESLENVKYLIRRFEDEKLESSKKDSGIDLQNALAQIKRKNDDDSEGITFDENRQGIEMQLKEILELKKTEGLDVRTLALLQKTEADLRVKLNDKFNVSDKTSEQYVIVQPKFNTICEHTRKECWLQTEKYAMEHWHLIKDPNFKE
jgi:hypothetical protein